MAKVKADYLLMYDGMVDARTKLICREASGLDFSNLQGTWIEVSSYNVYLETLMAIKGSIALKVIGRRVANVLNDLFGLFKNLKSLEDGFKVITNGFDDSFKGADKGYYICKSFDLDKKKVLFETTSPVIPELNIAVLEGIIIIFKFWPKRAEITKRLEVDGKTEFILEWG